MTDCHDAFLREGTGLWIVPFEALQSLSGADRTEITENYNNHKLHKLVPVESITPGDYIITHNRKLGQITEKIQKKYTGLITGIRHIRSKTSLYLCGSHRILAKEREISNQGDNFWKIFPFELYKKIKVNNKKSSMESDILWEYVQNEQLGTNFIKEYQIGPFISDFYSEDNHILIDIDDDPLTKQGQNYRNLMDSFFKSKGISVLRYTQEDIAFDLPNTLRHIKSVLLKRTRSAFKGKEWTRADALEIGDTIYYSPNQSPVKITEIEFEETTEILHGIKIDKPGSCITDVAAIFCPSVTEPV